MAVPVVRPVKAKPAQNPKAPAEKKDRKTSWSSFFSRLGWGLLYAAIPIIGWIALFRSFKRVKAGEIAALQTLDGRAEILEEGFYFRPAPGTIFSKSHHKGSDYIQFFPGVERIRVNGGEKGVMNENGQFIYLDPGIYLIEASKNQSYDQANGKKRISDNDYWLGADHFVRIEEGYLGEAYEDGAFRLLGPGQHQLPPGYRFEKKVSTAFKKQLSTAEEDIIDLGAMWIVTVKTGEVAIVRGTGPGKEVEPGSEAESEKGKYEILGPGKHEILQSEGRSFVSKMNTSLQTLKLDSLKARCNNMVDLEVECSVLYTIKNPILVMTSTQERICGELGEIATATLRSIIAGYSSSDLSPKLPDQYKADEDGEADEENEADEAAQPQAKIRQTLLKKISDSAIENLKEIGEKWGLEIEDFKIRHLNPADKGYDEAIRNIANSRVTTEAGRLIAKNKADVLATEAEGQRRQAEIQQQTEVTRAETEAKKMEIAAQANYNKTVKDAEGKAEAIKLVTTAENDGRERAAQIYTNMPPDSTAGRVFTTEAQGRALKEISQPVLFPQPGSGLNVSGVYRNNGGVTMFGGGGARPAADPTSLLVSAMALERVVPPAAPVVAPQ